MNTPLSPRMSTWDIPHVPPAEDPPEAEETIQEAPDSSGENVSPQEGPLGPLSRMSQDPSAGTAQVRFLNAVVEGGGDLRVTTGNRLLSSSLPPAGLSEYFTAMGSRFCGPPQTLFWVVRGKGTP